MSYRTASYDFKDEIIPKTEPEKCPICKSTSYIECDCGHKTCEKGHKWYYSDDGKVIIGVGHAE